MAVCGIKYINFTTETIKILGVHFFYNQKSQIPKNLAKSTSNRQNVLNLWRMRNITLEGEITIFRTLVLSKTVYLVLSKIVYLTNINSLILKTVNWRNKKNQKAFIWNNLTLQTKLQTLCNSFEEGGVKIDINSRFTSIQCLYDVMFQEMETNCPSFT